MLAGKSEVDAQLDYCQQQYSDKFKDEQKALLYARMACAEATGWLQITMDQIIINSAHYKNIQHKEKLDEMIKFNSNFDYKAFKSMLLGLLGYRGCELLEGTIDSFELDNLKSDLGRMADQRNDVSHVDSGHAQYGLRGPNHIDDPATTKQRLTQISNILNKLSSLIDKVKIETI
jgi:hypothetical protein